MAASVPSRAARPTDSVLSLDYTLATNERRNMAEKFLAFDEWKTVYHPAWYLNTREEDEQLFEEWLQYKKQQKEKNEEAGQ